MIPLKVTDRYGNVSYIYTRPDNTIVYATKDGTPLSLSNIFENAMDVQFRLQLEPPPSMALEIVRTYLKPGWRAETWRP